MLAFVPTPTPHFHLAAAEAPFGSAHPGLGYTTRGSLLSFDEVQYLHVLAHREQLEQRAVRQRLAQLQQQQEHRKRLAREHALREHLAREHARRQQHALEQHRREIVLNALITAFRTEFSAETDRIRIQDREAAAVRQRREAELLALRRRQQQQAAWLRRQVDVRERWLAERQAQAERAGRQRALLERLGLPAVPLQVEPVKEQKAPHPCSLPCPVSHRAQLERATHEPTTQPDVKSKGKAPRPAGSSPESGHSLEDALRHRSQTETDHDVQETLSALLSSLFGDSAAARNSAPTEAKGKARAEDTTPSAQGPHHSSEGVPHRHARAETDLDLQYALSAMLSNFFDPASPASPAADKPKKSVHFADAKATPGPSRSDAQPATFHPGESVTVALSADTPTVYRTGAISGATGAKLAAHRARKAALASVADVRAAFVALAAGFTLPAHLDFLPSPASEVADHDVDDGASTSSTGSRASLAYTARNRPLHAYQHALGELLTRLDAVDSQGDEAVREARRGVAGALERELDRVERAVEALREAHEAAEVTAAPAAAVEPAPTVQAAAPVAEEQITSSDAPATTIDLEAFADQSTVDDQASLAPSSVLQVADDVERAQNDAAPSVIAKELPSDDTSADAEPSATPATVDSSFGQDSSVEFTPVSAISDLDTTELADDVLAALESFESAPPSEADETLPALVADGPMTEDAPNAQAVTPGGPGSAAFEADVERIPISTDADATLDTVVASSSIKDLSLTEEGAVRLVADDLSTTNSAELPSVTSDALTEVGNAPLSLSFTHPTPVHDAETYVALDAEHQHDHTNGLDAEQVSDDDELEASVVVEHEEVPAASGAEGSDSEGWSDLA